MTPGGNAWLAGALLPTITLAFLSAGARLGAQLEAGAVLVYESEGAAQPPWTIDSLQLGAALRHGSECAIIHLRRRPDQPTPEESRLCLAHDTLYRWDARGERWTVSRPVGPDMVWATRQAGGDSVRYVTGKTREDTVSGQTIPVVLTTVTTADSLGRPKQRLRERYAVGLTTATGGVFETPDSASAGKWRTVRTFELREIRRP